MQDLVYILLRLFDAPVFFIWSWNTICFNAKNVGRKPHQIKFLLPSDTLHPWLYLFRYYFYTKRNFTNRCSSANFNISRKYQFDVTTMYENISLNNVWLLSLPVSSSTFSCIRTETFNNTHSDYCLLTLLVLRISCKMSFEVKRTAQHSFSL